MQSWALTNLNLTGGYISAGVVPDVGQGREVPWGSQRPSSELGGDWLAPPNSTGLVRLEEEEVGLPRLSGASGGSEFRLGTSERSGIRSDKACTYHAAQFQIRLCPLGSIMVLSRFLLPVYLSSPLLQVFPIMLRALVHNSQGHGDTLFCFCSHLLPSLDSPAHPSGSAQMLSLPGSLPKPTSSPNGTCSLPEQVVHSFNK